MFLLFVFIFTPSTGEYVASPVTPSAGGGGACSVSIEGSGSVIAVVATDAPLLPGQCKGEREQYDDSMIIV